MSLWKSWMSFTQLCGHPMRSRIVQRAFLLILPMDFVRLMICFPQLNFFVGVIWLRSYLRCLYMVWSHIAPLRDSDESIEDDLFQDLSSNGKEWDAPVVSSLLHFICSCIERQSGYHKSHQTFSPTQILFRILWKASRALVAATLYISARIPFVPNALSELLCKMAFMISVTEDDKSFTNCTDCWGGWHKAVESTFKGLLSNFLKCSNWIFLNSIWSLIRFLPYDDSRAAQTDLDGPYIA